MRQRTVGRLGVLSVRRAHIMSALIGAGLGTSTGPVLCQTPADLISANLPLEISSPAISDLNSDGYNDVIVVSTRPAGGLGPITPLCGIISDPYKGRKGGSTKGLAQPDGPGKYSLVVHALDGSRTPPFSAELPGQWPRVIGATCDNFHPTVAVGDINFDGQPDVTVGAYLTETRHVFAFRADGSDVPGWENVSAQDPPFFNAVTQYDANADGAEDLVVVDESCYLQRYNALGVRRQCQLVTNFAFASPAVSDVTRPGGVLQADGIPDEITAGWPGGHGVRAYSSFGSSLSCDDTADRYFSVAEDYEYSSSPAAADLDFDGTQDLVIQGGGASPRLRVFSSSGGMEEYALNTGTPTFARRGFSSPSITDLDGDGLPIEIVVGDDGGRLWAFQYQPWRPAGSRIQRLWDRVLDAGRSISSSPLVADVALADGLPEVIAATDGGNVHIVFGFDGSPVDTYSLLNGQPWSATAAVYSTPAVWTRSAGGVPLIIAGNRRGLFRIALEGYPVFNPAGAQWPTFRRNNQRTGSLPFDVIPTRGSVGGVATGCTQVQLRTADCSTIATDYYGGQAVATPPSGGRFLFEMRLPGPTCVRFVGPNPPGDWRPSVTAGVMSFGTFRCQ